MSDFGEEIINKLSNTTKLTINSDMGRLIDYTIGEWLQRENDEYFFEQFFLQEATGVYLDLHGKEYGVIRKINETDEDYRERIVLSSLGFLTVNYLREIYNIDLYSFVPNFNPHNNTLVSDNPYYDGKFMGIASDEVKNILNKKFVFGSGVVWL